LHSTSLNERGADFMNLDNSQTGFRILVMTSASCATSYQFQNGISSAVAQVGYLFPYRA
jgi:hypothetical protein